MNTALSVFCPLVPPGLPRPTTGKMAEFPPGFIAQSALAPAIFSASYLPQVESIDHQPGRSTEGFISRRNLTTQTLSQRNTTENPKRYWQSTNSSIRSSEGPGLPAYPRQLNSSAGPPVSGHFGTSVHSSIGPQRYQKQPLSVPGLRSSSLSERMGESHVRQHHHNAQLRYRHQSPIEYSGGSPAGHIATSSGSGFIVSGSPIRQPVTHTPFRETHNDTQLRTRVQHFCQSADPHFERGKTTGPNEAPFSTTYAPMYRRQSPESLRRQPQTTLANFQQTPAMPSFANHRLSPLVSGLTNYQQFPNVSQNGTFWPPVDNFPHSPAVPPSVNCQLVPDGPSIDYCLRSYAGPPYLNCQQSPHAPSRETRQRCLVRPPNHNGRIPAGPPNVNCQRSPHGLSMENRQWSLAGPQNTNFQTQGEPSNFSYQPSPHCPSTGICQQPLTGQPNFNCQMSPHGHPNVNFQRPPHAQLNVNSQPPPHGHPNVNCQRSPHGSSMENRQSSIPGPPNTNCQAPAWPPNNHCQRSLHGPPIEFSQRSLAGSSNINSHSPAGATYIKCPGVPTGTPVADYKQDPEGTSNCYSQPYPARSMLVKRIPSEPGLPHEKCLSNMGGHLMTFQLKSSSESRILSPVGQPRLETVDTSGLCPVTQTLGEVQRYSAHWIPNDKKQTRDSTTNVQVKRAQLDELHKATSEIGNNRNRNINIKSYPVKVGKSTPTIANQPSAVSHAKRPRDKEEPLDLSVKKTKLSEADPDSENDVIIMGIQAPNVNKFVSESVRQNPMADPNICVENKRQETMTKTESGTHASFFPIPSTSTPYQQSQSGGQSQLTDLEPDRSLQRPQKQINLISQSTYHFKKEHGSDTGESTRFPGFLNLPCQSMHSWGKREEGVRAGGSTLTPGASTQMVGRRQGIPHGQDSCPNDEQIRHALPGDISAPHILTLNERLPSSNSYTGKKNMLRHKPNKKPFKNQDIKNLPNEIRKNCESDSRATDCSSSISNNKNGSKRGSFVKEQDNFPCLPKYETDISDTTKYKHIQDTENNAAEKIPDQSNQTKADTKPPSKQLDDGMMRKCETGSSRAEDEGLNTCVQEKGYSGCKRPSSEGIKSNLSVADSAVRLVTLFEPVRVTRLRNGGCFDDHTHSPGSKVNQSDMQSHKKYTDSEQTSGEITSSKKPKLAAFRSKKEYILAHLQQDKEGNSTDTAKGTAQAVRGSETTGQGHLNGSNMKSSDGMLVDLNSPIDTDKTKRRDCTLATAPYVQKRVLAEVIEQSNTEIDVCKEDTRIKMSNPEYFPRWSTLELSNIKRIPVANVQPIIKDKTAAPEETKPDSPMPKHEISLQCKVIKREDGNYQQPPDEATALPQLKKTQMLNQQECKNHITLTGNNNSERPTGLQEHKDPFRTPTSPTLINPLEAISEDKEASVARKKLALHFSTPKGRHKLLLSDGSNPSSVERNNSIEMTQVPKCHLSAKCLNRDSKFDKKAVIIKRPGYKARTDPKSRESTRREAGRLANPGAGIRRPRKTSNARPATKRRSLMSTLRRDRTIQLGNHKNAPADDCYLTERVSGRKQDKKIPKRRPDRRQTRSSQLGRALRSSRNCNSYNKNSAYEAELRKEEERKLQRKENKHAQIRKTINMFNPIGDENPKKCATHTTAEDSPCRKETLQEAHSDTGQSPSRHDSVPLKDRSAKQLTIRRYRRRRKDYFHQDRGKNKRVLKQRQRTQVGVSIDARPNPRGNSKMDSARCDAVDADVCMTEQGNDCPVRTGDVNDTVISAGQTMVADARRLVVCKETGETTLHKAARLGYKDIAQSLMSCENVDVNVRDNAGYTPLHECCARGNVQIAMWLIQRGADANAKAYDGTRPLHDAVVNNHVQIVRLLLSHGADPNIANYSGNIPQKLARSTQMIAFLQGYLADLSAGGSPENPWEFDGFWQHPGVMFPEMSVLADAPDDEGDTEAPDTTSADEIVFEFTAGPPLPVFNVCADQTKGPRNFYLLKDVVSRLDTTAKHDLLNNDLIIVEVAMETYKCLSSAMVMSGPRRPLQQFSTTVALVEINASLQRKLEISMESLTKFEPVFIHSFTVSDVYGGVMTHTAAEKSRICGRGQQSDAHLKFTDTRLINERKDKSLQSDLFWETTNLLPKSYDLKKSCTPDTGTENVDNNGCRKTEEHLMSVAKREPSVVALAHTTEVKPACNDGEGESVSGVTTFPNEPQPPETLSEKFEQLSELPDHSPDSVSVGEVESDFRIMTLGGQEDNNSSPNIYKEDSGFTPPCQYLTLGLVTKQYTVDSDRQTSSDRDRDAHIVTAARFLYIPPGDGTFDCDASTDASLSKFTDVEKKGQVDEVKTVGLSIAHEKGWLEHSNEWETDTNKPVERYCSRDRLKTIARESVGSVKDSDSSTQASYILRPDQKQHPRSQAPQPIMENVLKSDKQESCFSEQRELKSLGTGIADDLQNAQRKWELLKFFKSDDNAQKCSADKQFRGAGDRSPNRRVEGRQEGGDPSLPVLEILNMQQTSNETKEETVLDNRQMPKLTLCI